MNIKSIKKNIKNNILHFPEEMYATLPGSIIVSAYMLTEDKDSFPLKDVRKTWKKLKHDNLPFGYDEGENIIQKTLDLFGVKKPENFPVAFVQSDYNALVVPYVDNRIFGIREDGFLPRTLREGKIYPIVENTSEEE